LSDLFELFPEFYDSFELEEEDFNEDSGNIIVLDTNFLLDVLRLPNDYAKEYLKAINKTNELIYIPYLVALEFSFNKSSVKKEKSSNINNYKQSITQKINEIRENIENVDIINIKGNKMEFYKEFLDILDTFENTIINKINSKIGDTIIDKDNETYEELLRKIRFRIGNKYSQDWIEKIEKIGKQRYEDKIPPGFNDNNKDDTVRKFGGISYHLKYGDLIIWKDLLSHLKENGIKNKKVIFVTSDGTSKNKIDITYKIKGMVVGPHINLISEIFRETGNHLFILNNTKFIKRVNNLTNERSRELDHAINDDTSQISLDELSKYLINIQNIDFSKITRQISQINSINKNIPNISKFINQSITSNLDFYKNLNYLHDVHGRNNDVENEDDVEGEDNLEDEE